MGESSRGGPAFWGEMKNNGEKTLRRVEITVYCLDEAGKPVFEKAYYPVSVPVSFFNSSEHDKLLKPNYGRKFGYRLDSVPSAWAGKIDVKVTEVEILH